MRLCQKVSQPTATIRFAASPTADRASVMHSNTREARCSATISTPPSWVVWREYLRRVPTSGRTAEIAQSFGIPLRRLDERSFLDIYIDGADEVDPQLNLVKGRGGALMREKLVASAARRFAVIVDETKRVERLGELAPI